MASRASLNRKYSVAGCPTPPRQGVDRPRFARQFFLRESPLPEKRKPSKSRTVKSHWTARETALSDHGAGSVRGGGARRPRRAAEDGWLPSGDTARRTGSAKGRKRRPRRKGRGSHFRSIRPQSASRAGRTTTPSRWVCNEV